MYNFIFRFFKTYYRISFLPARIATFEAENPLRIVTIPFLVNRPRQVNGTACLMNEGTLGFAVFRCYPIQLPVNAAGGLPDRIISCSFKLIDFQTIHFV